MQIEEGKFYRTRDGQKIGPMLVWSDSTKYRWSDHPHNGTDIWTDAGLSQDGMQTPSDLTAEWTDEPDETTAAIRGVIEASEPGQKYLFRKPDGVNPRAEPAGSLLPAARLLLDLGTVPALLAAGDVIRREIARLEGK